MANVKTGITRRNALAMVWEYAKDNGFTESEQYFEGVGTTIENMLASLASKAAPTGPSKIQRENAAMLDKFLPTVAEAGEEGISAREFAAAFLPLTPDGKPATQKATRILVQGINDGKLVRVPQEKKSAPMRYKVA